MVVRKPPYKKCWLDFQGYMDPIWDIHKWPAVFLNANSQPRRTRRSDSASFRNCNASETLVFRWDVDGIVLGAGFFFKDRFFGKFHACLPGEMIHFLSFGFLECSPLPTYFWIFVLNFHPENWGNDPFCLGNSNMFLGIFTPTYPGEMIGPILTIIFFQMGWLTPPTRLYMYWLQKPLSAIII